MKSPRFAPLTGIVFVVLLIIGFVPLSGDTPDSDAAAPDITSYYNDHQGREIAGGIVVALAVIFLAFFVVALWNYLRDTGGGGDFWPTVALVGGVVSLAGFFTAITVHAALLDGADSNISGDAMIALNSLDNWDFFGFAAPLAVMLFGIAGSVMKGGAALPRWLGWVALVLGILYFAGPFGFFAFMLTGIWIIVASILMYRRAGAPAGATPIT
jgi:hypothetical protein